MAIAVVATPLAAITANVNSIRICATASVFRQPVSCTLVTRLDVTLSRGDRMTNDLPLVATVRRASSVAGVDPRLLLAVLIRESGDIHLLDWLSQTLLGDIHGFTIGISNLGYDAFAEGRQFSRGIIDYPWSSIADDPEKAILATAFVLAKRSTQLNPRRSQRIADSEYLRIGYRAGYVAMKRAEETGQYPPGLELFDLAYSSAKRAFQPRAFPEGGRFRWRTHHRPWRRPLVYTFGPTVGDAGTRRLRLSSSGQWW